MQRSENFMTFSQADLAHASRESRRFDSYTLKSKLEAHIETCYAACGSPRGVDLVRFIAEFVKSTIVEGDDELKRNLMAFSILTTLQERTFFVQSDELHHLIPEEIYKIISRTKAAIQADLVTIEGHQYTRSDLRDLSQATFDNRRFTSYILMYYLLLKKTKCFGQQWQRSNVNRRQEGWVGNLEIPLLSSVVAAFRGTPAASPVALPAASPVAAPAALPVALPAALPVPAKRTVEVDDSEKEPTPKKPYVRDDTVYVVEYDPSEWSHNEGDDF